MHKLKEVLKNRKRNKLSIDYSHLDFNRIFDKVLQNIQIDRKIFYAAKLNPHPDTLIKSEELIRFQRKLRNTLTSQGYEFTISGNVRGQKVGGKIIFKEKGVDVRIAVDMVALACDKKLSKVILCSSDSDLQPAILEVKSRNVEVIYLGFEKSPNKGLSYTTSRTILLNESEILEACNLHRSKKKPQRQKKRGSNLRTKP